jgi:hypothetical protein
MHRQTLARREKVLGHEHPDTLTSMNNLATVLESQGKYEEAEAIHRQTLERTEKVLGHEHPDTLTSMGNLAGVQSHRATPHHNAHGPDPITRKYALCSGPVLHGASDALSGDLVTETNSGCQLRRGQCSIGEDCGYAGRRHDQASLCPEASGIHESAWPRRHHNQA